MSAAKDNEPQVTHSRELPRKRPTPKNKKPKRPNPVDLVGAAPKINWYEQLSQDDKQYIEETVALAVQQGVDNWTFLARELKKLLNIKATDEAVANKIRRRSNAIKKAATKLP